MEVGKTLENMEHFSPDTKAEKLDLRNPIDFTEPRKNNSFNPHDACNYCNDDFFEDADDEIDTRPYEELSEEEQWNFDNPDYPYEDAKFTDDLYGTNDIEEWKEYKDLKVNSENPDSFISYKEWQDEKSAWEEDHPDGPPYADMMHDAILSEDSDAQAELSRWREYRQEKENSDAPDYYPSYEDWKNGTKRLDTRPYAELTEEEQYNFDNTPFSQTYDEAKEIAEVFEPPVNPIPEWQEYREAKLKSENPDDFMSYKDWIDEKGDWKRDHPEGPDYAETFQKAFIEGDIKSQEEFSEWNKYRDDRSHCKDLSIFPTYREWQTGKYAPNSTVEIDGVECKTDDNGKVIKGETTTPENQEQKGLTNEQKEQIRKETGWSDEIIDHIDSMEQYEIYKNADLHEAEINGKKCLVKDIDMDYVDPKTGLTNRELMAKGRSPIDAKTGEKIELHHMGQDKDGPFAELCENSEHGDGNHSTLHPKTEESWRKEEGAASNYDNERKEHWKARTQEA